MLGLYVSDHPLLGLEHVLANGTDCTIGQLMLDEERPDGTALTISGLVTSVQRKITKRGDAWAMVTLEDLDGAIDVLLFPSAYQLASTYLTEDAIITVKGRLSRSKDQPELHGQEVTVPDLADGPSGPVVISLPVDPVHRPGRRPAQGRPGHPPGHDRGAAAAVDPRRDHGDAARRPASGHAEPGPVRRPQAAAGPGMPEQLTTSSDSTRGRPLADRCAPPGRRGPRDLRDRREPWPACVWDWVWTAPSGVVYRGEWRLLDPVEAPQRLLRDRLYVVVASIAGLLLGALCGLVVHRRELLTLAVGDRRCGPGGLADGAGRARTRPSGPASARRIGEGRSRPCPATCGSSGRARWSRSPAAHFSA